MADKRKDGKGRNLRSGEYYDEKNDRYMFRKMIDGERYTITADSLVELRKQENDLLCKLDRGLKVDNKKAKMTLNEYFDYWLENYSKNGRKVTTVETYRADFETYVRKSLGKKRITKIIKADCQQLVNKMAADGLSKSTISIVKSCLNVVFENAIDEDVILKNPIRNIDLPKTKRNKREAIELEQVKLFMDYVKNSPRFNYAYPAYVTLFNTGLRISELCAITLEDLDFKNSKIKITKQVNCYRKKIFGFTRGVGTVKREASEREVPMNSTLKRVLLTYVMKSSKSNVSLPYVDDLGIKRGDIKGFVFLNSQNTTWCEPSFFRLTKKIIEEYNLEAEKDGREQISDFCPHMARHTYTSLCYEAGADVKSVSETLGHSSVQITLDTYTHITQNKAQEQLEAAQTIKIS